MQLRDNQTGEPYLSDLPLPIPEGKGPLDVIEGDRSHPLVVAFIAHLRDKAQENYRLAATRGRNEEGYTAEQLLAAGRSCEEICLSLFAIHAPEALEGGETLHPASDE